MENDKHSKMDSINQSHNNVFPFTAVQGQPLFKLALLLATVNPLIGGVLISGPRGCAKSTLARGVADLLPAKQDLTPQFVTLPLGASEEMLIGTLDLEQVLNNKSVQFSAGLLKKAHGGVLYVDEVNLLPDHLVDQLLDVASSGVNIVERDGISHSHEAAFTLIGTMNPDEGELRPQLQDRFGLMVELDNNYSLDERINIVKTRQAFEADKGLFCDQYQVQQIVLQQQISDAQKRLVDVTCAEHCFIDIAKRCQQANVEGLRADIMMHRASITHAAWCGRSEVTLDDIEQVAPLVLLHRRQSGGTPPNSGKDNKTEQSEQQKTEQNQPATNSGFSRPQVPQTPAQTEQSETDANTNSGNESGNDNGTGNDSHENVGEWGAMPTQNAESQKTGEAINLTLPALTTHLAKQSKNQDSLVKRHSAQDKQTSAHGAQKSALEGAKPDWFSTISNSIGAWPPAKFAYKKLAKGQQHCHLILLDTSASTLSQSLSSLAKSVVVNIAQSAYLQRDKMSVLGFGNDQIETIIKAGRAPKKIENQLDEICAAGGTPLRLALQNAANRINSLTKQYPSLQLFCYLITDGRSRVDLEDLKLSVPTLLIDIEKSQVKRGRGKVLATQLDASYLAIQG
ncbi:AAA family ATPase [Psychromonas sp. Urea-02u-13]|uniref:AAA family ATPase n=1 Tax=Psychromonas sp. Urea-02u-13 TaxID=2058326 RepID=UPI000C3454A6|nr:AAA family ATPase [Psychromonas sp. Urea-02u-13]PKG40951.1 magnesium chelatase [Psychromonas sp. Urea-02u-13]